VGQLGTGQDLHCYEDDADPTSHAGGTDQSGGGKERSTMKLLVMTVLGIGLLAWTMGKLCRRMRRRMGL